MMMHMTLYWGKDLTLLFDGWTTDSWPTYSLTLLACFLFSLLYQYMESLRLRFKSATALRRPPHPSAGITTPLLLKLGGTRRGLRRLAHAALFGINSAVGYFLMLAIMSYNGGVFLSVVLGISVAYYLFRSGDDVVDDGDGDGGVAVVVENSCGCS